MVWQNLIRDLPISRSEVRAHSAFLLHDRDAFYIVESGYVDLFAVVTKQRTDALTRVPFVARIPAGKVFFGGQVLSNTKSDESLSFVFQAVPSRHTILIEGKRENLASKHTFDLDYVSLIDDWVVAVSEFVSRYGLRTPREALFLEADPDVRYEADSVAGQDH